VSSASRPAVVVLGSEPDLPPRFLADAGAYADLRLAESPEALAAALPGADVLYAWSYEAMGLLDGVWKHAGDVRWIQTSGIGVDGVLIGPVLAGDVLVTNTRGVIELPLAEHVLAMVLTFVKDLPRTLELQARHEWRHRETETLRGRRALVLGAGGVGRASAELLAAAGMDVELVARTARPTEPIPVRAIADLDALLPSAEFLILAVPLSASTRGLIGRERLARLPRGARLVNVARGPVLDWRAVLDALASGHLAGAALDVFDDEPLPAEHPLWDGKNVIITPHMAGDAHGWREGVAARFVANLARWAAGEPLEGVVDKAAAAG
jgi:phosphoglycerate dehydrogenase-like enzyme